MEIDYSSSLYKPSTMTRANGINHVKLVRDITQYPQRRF